MLKGAAHLHSVYHWYLYRDIMSRALIGSSVRLGGVGVTVKIGESKCGYKRKYNRGRLLKEDTSIFLALLNAVQAKMFYLLAVPGLPKS